MYDNNNKATSRERVQTAHSGARSNNDKALKAVLSGTYIET